MNEPIRHGIIGCAGIGNSHAEAVKTATGVELVACADVDTDASAAFASEHGISATYTDPGEMIADSDVDAVSVCTPSGTHADLVVEAAEAGAHVLCEKPLDVYADRVNRMVETCENEGVTLAGVFQRRFEPDVRRAKRAMREGDLGDPILGDTAVKWFRSQPYYDSSGWRGTRDMDGGCLMNQGIHEIDKLQWLMGGVESVTALTDTLARDLDCEDTAAIALRFENGALGTIEVTTAVKGGADRTEINGTDGSLALRDSSIVDFQVGTGEETHYGAETESREVDGDQHPCGTGHVAVVQDFVTALREGREPEVPAREARIAVDIILAAYRSAETGERVTLESIRDE